MEKTGQPWARDANGSKSPPVGIGPVLGRDTTLGRVAVLGRVPVIGSLGRAKTCSSVDGSELDLAEMEVAEASMRDGTCR